MKIGNRVLAAAFAVASLGAIGAYAVAQEGPAGGRMGMGRGMMDGMGRGMGHGMDHGMGHGMDHGVTGQGAGHEQGAGRGSRRGSDQGRGDGADSGMQRHMGRSAEEFSGRPGMGRMGMGQGMGMGRGMGMMGGGDATSSERQELHAMFVSHDRISRTVSNLPNGIRTVTESDDPELAKTIVSHVAGMMKRVEESRDPRLPMQSPTLRTIFANKDKIETTFDSTSKGIVVTQTSNDAETVAALQKHAAEVTDLVNRGMVAAHETMMKNAAGRSASHEHR